jgi:hypothetical protein
MPPGPRPPPPRPETPPAVAPQSAGIRRCRAAEPFSIAAAVSRSIVQRVAQLEQELQLGLEGMPVGRRHVAGERIGGLVQRRRQRERDQPEQRVEPVLLGEELEDRLVTERTRSRS